MSSDNAPVTFEGLPTSDELAAATGGAIIKLQDSTISDLARLLESTEGHRVTDLHLNVPTADSVSELIDLLHANKSIVRVNLRARNVHSGGDRHTHPDVAGDILQAIRDGDTGVVRAEIMTFDQYQLEREPGRSVPTFETYHTTTATF